MKRLANLAAQIVAGTLSAMTGGNLSDAEDALVLGAARREGISIDGVRTPTRWRRA